MWNKQAKPMYDIAIKMVMIMPALLLQKPTNKSSAKQHTEYLKKDFLYEKRASLMNFLETVGLFRKKSKL